MRGQSLLKTIFIFKIMMQMISFLTARNQSDNTVNTIVIIGC